MTPERRAALLAAGRLGPHCDPARATGTGDLGTRMPERDTRWGRLTHLGPVVDLERTPMRWERAPAPLGSHAAEWLPR